MKRLANLLSQAIKANFAFKLRAFFCIISVALGIAAITVIVAATEGAYQKAFEIVDKFGPDSVMIIGGSDESRAVGKRDKTLTVDDVQAIRESFSNAYLVVPVSMLGAVTASYKNKKYQTRIIGSNSNYSLVWSWPVVQGADITKEDVKSMKNVGLIGQFLALELFEDQNPVGRYLFVNQRPVQIVGILQARGTNPRGHNLDNRIVMPITTVMRKMQNEKKYVSMIRARFADQNNLDYHVAELKRFLRNRHSLSATEPDDFTIISPKEIIKFLVALTGSLILFLGVSGIISLVVAGFVLANLFFLSVKERGIEIGIRRSFGAKQRDILVQFVGESVILTSTGGLVGFGIALLSSKLLMFVADFPIFFSWKAFAAGVVLSSLIGILSGIQPAIQAARLNPIEAVRK